MDVFEDKDFIYNSSKTISKSSLGELKFLPGRHLLKVLRVGNHLLRNSA